MRVREERDADAPAVREVNRTAFGRADEADLVDRIRERAGGYFALVAIDGEERVVGQIAFSAVTLEPARPLLLFGLAPMAVRPEWQRRGVGSQLVRAGLDQARRRGADAVFVLGHPDYYLRFGFEPAAARGIASVYQAPDAFFVLELVPSALRGVTGTAHYDPALAG